LRAFVGGTEIDRHYNGEIDQWLPAAGMPPGFKQLRRRWPAG
jgi:hypothetical protein